MRILFGVSLVSLALLFSPGCGDDQTVDAGTKPQGQGGSRDTAGTSGAGGTSSGAGGTDPGGAAGEASGAAGTSPATGVVVNVVYGGTSRPVDLGTLPTSEVNGQKLASIVDLWTASNTPAELAKVQFDFEGDDGFRPSTKGACKTPITGAQLSKGYIDPQLRNLFWDDSLGLSGCYRVKGLAKVLASDATP